MFLGQAISNNKSILQGLEYFFIHLETCNKCWKAVTNAIPTIYLYKLSKFNLSRNINLSVWIAPEPSLHRSKCGPAFFRCFLEIRALGGGKQIFHEFQLGSYLHAPYRTHFFQWLVIFCTYYLLAQEVLGALPDWGTYVFVSTCMWVFAGLACLHCWLHITVKL